jgi:catechol 2,3-dioxygenase-like lactoylglutathione lyase family enzyme
MSTTELVLFSEICDGVTGQGLQCDAVMLESARLVAFVPTSNFDKARSFYEGVLGLKFLSQDPFALVMETNGTTVRLAKVGNLTPAQFTILGWEVEDIENTVRSLAAKGVSFERFPGMQQDELGIWTAPGGDRVAWFKDPDENILSLSQSGRE